MKALYREEASGRNQWKSVSELQRVVRSCVRSCQTSTSRGKLRHSGEGLWSTPNAAVNHTDTCLSGPDLYTHTWEQNQITYSGEGKQDKMTWPRSDSLIYPSNHQPHHLISAHLNDFQGERPAKAGDSSWLIVTFLELKRLKYYWCQRKKACELRQYIPI